MTGIIPRELVDGPPRLAVPYGLFSLLAFRSGQRWEGGGVTWETLTCEPLGTLGMVDCDPQTTATKDLAKMPVDPGHASPFTVYGHYTCSPVGVTDEAYNLAVAHLTTREEQQVEQTLWTGDLGNVPNFSGANGYPAPTDVTPANGATVWQAVSTLELEFPEEYGSLGVLHMSRKNASLALAAGALSSTGGRLVTALGTPVVAGVGYPNTEIVASSQLFAYRSDIFPGDLGASGFLNTENNNYTALAERSYLIGFDPCGLASVTVS